MADVSPIIREQEGVRLRAAFRRAKLRKRITQADVAADCGWQSASTFNRVLSGKIALSSEVLLKLSKLLDFHPAEISPRLAHAEGSVGWLSGARMIPVSLVKAVSRGSWGEPFLTAFGLPFPTHDNSAFCLIFDAASAPTGLDGWALVVEPSGVPGVGDRVIIRHGIGNYSYGCVSAAIAEGSYPVDVPGKGLVLARAKQCMLVTALVRQGAMHAFRACAEKTTP